MAGTGVVASLLKAELYREIKAFIDRRPKRYGPDNPRYRVTLDTLMALKIKFGELSLKHLEMIAAIHNDSVQGVIGWMKSKSPDLEDQRPAELINTGEGIGKVEREIEKLFRAF